MILPAESETVQVRLDGIAPEQMLLLKEYLTPRREEPALIASAYRNGNHVV